MEILLITIFLSLAWLVVASGGVFGSPGTRDRRARFKVDQVLRRTLDRGSYCVIRNVTLPTCAGPTTIDHVVVSRFGVFVIETGRFSGWVYGDSSQRTWTHASRRGEATFPNPLRQQLKATKSISAFLGCDESLVNPVLVFAGRGRFAAGMPPNVVYLDFLVPYIRERREPAISPNEVLRFADRLLDLEDAAEFRTPAGRIDAVD